MVLLRISVSALGFLYHDLSQVQDGFKRVNLFSGLLTHLLNGFLCGATAEVLYVGLLDGFSNQHHPQGRTFNNNGTLSDCQVSAGFL
jgi:hypothetical protein